MASLEDYITSALFFHFFVSGWCFEVCNLLHLPIYQCYLLPHVYSSIYTLPKLLGYFNHNWVTSVASNSCMVECTPIKVLQLFCWPMTPFSSLAYSMITHTPPVAGKLPIKTMVARQRPTSSDAWQWHHACMHAWNELSESREWLAWRSRKLFQDAWWLQLVVSLVFCILVTTQRH